MFEIHTEELVKSTIKVATQILAGAALKSVAEKVIPKIEIEGQLPTPQEAKKLLFRKVGISLGVAVLAGAAGIIVADLAEEYFFEDQTPTLEITVTQE